MKKILPLLCLFILSYRVSVAQCAVTTSPTGACASFGDSIDGFTLNAIPGTGSNGCSANSYGFFANPIWTLTIGNTYNFNAVLGGGSWSEGFAIWIDLNNDGFYATSELMYTGTPSPSQTGTINIPFSAVSGSVLRMRLRCAYNYNIAAADACTNNLNTTGEGETEDYQVYLTCPSGVPALSITASPSTLICQGATATLSASGASSYTWSGGVSNGASFSPTTTTSYTVTAGIVGCPSATTTAVKTISVTSTPLTLAASTPSAVICASKQNSLMVSGANNFVWQPGGLPGSTVVVTPTVSTTYTVTGTNTVGGCPGTTTLALTVNPNPIIQISVSPSVICEGMPASLALSGGTSYTWQTSGLSGSNVTVNPLLSTSYQVLGANQFGCTSLATQVLLVSPNPVISLTTSDYSVCQGNGVTITASGANNYVWSLSGATSGTITDIPMTTTTYSVVGSSNYTLGGSSGSCSGSNSITVAVLIPSVTITSPTAICSGNEATLTVNGADSYTWNTSSIFQNIYVTPNTTSTYSVATLTNFNGINCPGMASVALVVNPSPSVTVSAPRTTICKNESVTLTAGGATSYTWTDANASTTSSISATSNVVTTLIYSVTGTSAQGCKTTTTIAVNVNGCNGINEAQNFRSEVSLYPNPSNGIFSINLIDNSPKTIEVLDITGKVVFYQKNETGSVFTGSILSQPAGLYFIHIKNNAQTIAILKMVKQ
jgi:hypothetical protein